MKVIFTGGGSLGHVYPLLAVIREMKKNYSAPDLDLYYFGPKDARTNTMFSAEGIKVKTIPSGKIRRYASGKNFFDIFRVFFGTIKALFSFFFLAPDVVFSKGGHGSFPTVFAARLLHIPIFLHESDVTPGLASRIEGRWAIEIFTSFRDTERFSKEQMVRVGNPIRTSILEGSREEAKKLFKLEGKKPILLILGGSQGSRNVNNLILEILPELLENFELIHQSGRANYKQTKMEANVLATNDLKIRYHLEPFLTEKQLANALAVCDLVISRAGSGAIFEIAASKKPSLLIPLQNSAQDHQLKNAYKYKDHGACEILEEANLKPHFFLEKLKYLFDHPEMLQAMAEATDNFSKPKAARVIANYLLEFLYRSFVPVKGV